MTTRQSSKHQYCISINNMVNHPRRFHRLYVKHTLTARSCLCYPNHIPPTKSYWPALGLDGSGGWKALLSEITTCSSQEHINNHYRILLNRISDSWNNIKNRGREISLLKILNWVWNVIAFHCNFHPCPVLFHFLQGPRDGNNIIIKERQYPEVNYNINQNL